MHLAEAPTAFDAPILVFAPAPAVTACFRGLILEAPFRNHFRVSCALPNSEGPEVFRQ